MRKLASLLFFALLAISYLSACDSGSEPTIDGDESDGDIEQEECTQGNTKCIGDDVYECSASSSWQLAQSCAAMGDYVCLYGVCQLQGQTDGDADGDVIDGDSDGDATDGDVDGDAADGDSDTDGDAEGELVWPSCVAGDIAARELPISADETFYIGPYVMDTRPSSTVVKWSTAEPGDSIVLLGASPESLAEAANVGESTTLHEVLIDGLTANTRYYYAVKTGDSQSATHSFYTAVEAGQSFRFAVWGDNQNGPEMFETVLAGIAQANPYILVGVGDHVQDGSDDSLWLSQLFGPARAIFHERPFFAAMGNHERNSSNYYNLYAYPHDEEGGQDESTYSFTYGNAFFLVIDTNKMFFPLGDSQTELSQFIMDAVNSPEAKAATWRIALGHEPGYSEAWGNGDCEYQGYQPLRGWFLPLLAEHGFQVYFSGHMHGYERAQTSDGLVQIVTGGGGGGLDAWCRDWPETTVEHYAHHFLTVDAGCDSLRIEAHYPNGDVFDWVELNTDTYGEIQDQGPIDDLPDPVINDDARDEWPGFGGSDK